MDMGFLIFATCLAVNAKFICYMEENRIRLWSALPISMAIAIVFVYVFGLFQKLTWGVYLFVGLSVVCLVFLLVRKQLSPGKAEPQFAIFACLCLFFFVAHINRGLSHGDEFSHWALTVKNMFLTDRLGCDAFSLTNYKEYPPATAIFELFALKLSGVYAEEDLFRGISLFIIIPILAIVDAIAGRSRGKVLTFFAISGCAVPTIFYYAYTETLVDCSLGVFFAFVFVAFYQYMRTKDRFFLMQGCLAALILSMIKSTGVGLLALCAITIFLNAVENKCVKAGAIYIAAASVFGAVGSCSWKIALRLNNGVSRWGSGASAIEKTQNIAALTPDMAKGIISDFIKSFIYPNNSLNFVNVSYVLLSAVIVGVLLFLSFKYGRAYKLPALGILIGEVIFAGSILVLYFTVWGCALQDGSFYRYMNTYFTGAVLVVLFLILKDAYPDGCVRISRNAVIVTALVLLSLCRPLELIRLAAGPVAAFKSNSTEYLSSEALPFPVGTLYTDDVAVIQLGITPLEACRYGYYYVPYKLFEAEDLKDAERIASEYSLTGYVLVSENGESMTYISCQ